MKNTVELDRAAAIQTAHLLQLSYSLESALGAGVTPSQSKGNGLGWTTEQLLNLSAAKALFN